MGTVLFDISMSLDGYIAGPNDDMEQPLGAGRRLFEEPTAQPIELESTRFIASPGATHLRFRIVK